MESLYVKILRLMSNCDSSLIHWAKIQDLCAQWAELGRYIELQCISLIPLTLLFELEATACLSRKANLFPPEISKILMGGCGVLRTPRWGQVLQQFMESL